MATTKEDVEERDFTAYADKVPTGTMEAFADWIIDEVFGGEFPGTQKDEKAFRQGVQLGGTLRMEFQASDYWRTDERNPRSDAGKKARAAANGGPKTSTRGKGKAAAADEDEEAPAKPTRAAAAKGKTAAAKPGTRRGAAKPAAGKTTTTRRTSRRGAAAAASNDAEAPY